MKTRKTLIILILISSFSYSQTNKLKLNLDESGKTYIKGFVRGQFWTRYTDMNPGTTVNGEAVDQAFDFSIRRLRMGLSAQLSPKLYVYTMFGGNNLNQKNLNSTYQFLRVLDMNAEYEFSPEFSLGTGLSSWDGLSRWTTRASGSMMTLDAPLFSMLTVDKNDALSRGLGIWIKGQVGKLDYVFSIKNPTTFGVAAKEGVVDYTLNKPSMRHSGYIKYEFFDDESNKSAYSGGTGTYLGKKKIFNFGVGYLMQAEMTSSLVSGVQKNYDFKNWTAELFYDAPLNIEKGTAITSYLGYFDTDFGPNYIRNVGANGFANGGTSLNGAGSAFPMMGTGSTIFYQLGYLMLKTKNGTQLQPNLAIQYSDFDGLNDPTTVYDIGINCYFKGHANKLSLNYQSRPIYNKTTKKVDERKGMIVLQYQIEIN